LHYSGRSARVKDFPAKKDVMKREQSPLLQAKLLTRADLNSRRIPAPLKKLFTDPTFSVKLLSLSVPTMNLRHFEQGRLSRPVNWKPVRSLKMSRQG
jgi:hypothetical protein